MATARRPLLFPKGAGQGKTPFAVDIEVAEPFTARSLVLYPAEMQFAAQCELQAAGADGAFRTIRQFPLDRSNTNVQRGSDRSAGRWLCHFPPQTAKHFRLVFTDLRGKGGLAEIELSGAARLERFVEKQLGKMHPTPLPMWDTYLWPTPAEPEAPGLAVPPGAVLDLTRQAGRRRHAALGCARRGLDHPAHRHDADGHPQRPGVTRRAGAGSGQDEPRRRPGALRRLHRQALAADADGRPQGLQARRRRQLRDGLAELDGRFQRAVPQALRLRSAPLAAGADGPRRGQRRPVRPFPLGPAPAGGGPGCLRLRRRAARRVPSARAAALAGELRPLGLPGGVPAIRRPDRRVSGEFWATGDLGSIELRCASSAAHTYGKPIVSPRRSPAACCSRARRGRSSAAATGRSARASTIWCCTSISISRGRTAGPA